MRVVIQRVSQASVTIEGQLVSEIASGLLVLLGIMDSDTTEDIQWLSNKLTNLRIFNDADGVMNTSLKDSNGSAIVVSQFTLYAQTKKGNRPSYIKAAKPEIAKPLYEQFIKQFEADLGQVIQTGAFGADMKVALLNDGPVTIVMDSKARE
ncbi:D-aminoacyl-tRNA deacylase [Flavobacteriaceae bacterium]|jgi:D-aminoacyl-tRNA deacylase|nr:D-aminoacyl-tRNA deacylase [Flavobacteriaceae bacterium]MDC0118021.1 D-aminoacyl-tRNA deacylase [bacterium]MDG1393626.1 D-aminoacyl-tRNA deacylase [Flavobacteriaceae bacterium]